MKKINIITLGCSKNTVDSEKLAYQLKLSGYKVYHNSGDLNFDIAIVNTCGFINDAKEESINTILQLINAKNLGKIRKIIVFGCLAERYMSDLKEELPEVDVFLGNYDQEKILNILELASNSDKQYSRILDSPGHYAYVKIAEGCNRKCSFCAIPLFKGKYVSREISDIVKEVSFLASKGVKEIMLIAQDLSFYGYDKNKKFLLPQLVEELSKINNIEWIRLHYLYPFLFPDELIDIIATNPKVCKYIDIPLQHISDKVLTAMNRGGTKEQVKDLLEKFRNRIPDVVIRTTMLVGHPTESEKEFEELIEFVKEQKFDRLGVFTYSEEEGTLSAKTYPDDIDLSVKEERANILMDIQRGISHDLNSKKTGKVYKVIVDRVEGDYFIGRTEYDSVEVDNEILISSDKELSIGNFYFVEITSFDDYELYATPL